MAKIMEQPIVDFLRQQLNFSGFPLPSVSEDENHLIVYEQDSYKQNSELLELFQHASKCNANPDILWTDNADFGKPEFIIINTHNNLAIVVECKPKIANHSSKKLREEGILVRDSKVISRYSVEGALHYAKYLSANYDVIAIAVSAIVVCSPVASSTSISRGLGRGEMLLARPISRSVSPLMADTTTTI